MSSFSSDLEQYRAKHRTPGCKLMHLIGVPLIVLAIPMLFFNWRRALVLFGAGCLCQLTGHYLFEHNQPLFMGNPRKLNTYLSALVFVAEEWMHLLSGHCLSDGEGSGSAGGSEVRHQKQ